MPPNARMRDVGFRAAAVVTPVLGWAAVTWPWVTRMWREVPGGDGAGFVWVFWWWRHALATGRSPLVTDAMFVPAEVPLAYHTGMPLPAVASIPLQLVLGTPLAYNVTAVALVVFACAATVALARDLGLARGPALLAGLAFACSPALADRYALLEHLNLATVGWIPLLLLALRRWQRRPGPGRVVLVGLAGAAAVWSDLTVAVWTAMAAVSWAVAVLVGRRLAVPALRAVTGAVVAAVVAAVLVAPLAVALRDAAVSGAVDLTHGLGGSPRYATDLAGLLVGDAENPVLGAVTGPLAARLGARAEGANDLGVTIVVLAAVGVAATVRSARTWWLVGLAAAAVVLSLGPVLVVAGARFTPLPVVLAGETVSGLLPFTWLQRAPLLSGLRAPGRFTILAALPLALLAGQGAAALARRRAGRGLVLLAVPLLLVEAASPVDDRLPVATPAVYRTVAADPDPHAVVVDVPLGFRTGFGQAGRWSDAAMLHATDHGKRIATGFTSRLARERFRTVVRVPLYADLMALQDLRAGAPRPATDPDAGRASAAALGLEWAVLDTSVPGAEAVRTYLAAACYAPVEAADGRELYRFGCGDPRR